MRMFTPPPSPSTAYCLTAHHLSTHDAYAMLISAGLPPQQKCMKQCAELKHNRVLDKHKESVMTFIFHHFNPCTPSIRVESETNG